MRVISAPSKFQRIGNKIRFLVAGFLNKHLQGNILMKTIDLAAGLNLSVQMVNRLKRQGMPSNSLEAAIAWRKSNLEPFRTKFSRIGGNTGKKYQPTPKAATAYPAEEINGVEKALTKLIPEIWFGQTGWLGTGLREQNVKITAEQLIETQAVLFLIYMSVVDDLLKKECAYKFPATLTVRPGDKGYPQLIARLNQILSEESMR